MVKEDNPFISVLKIADFRNLWLSQVFSQVFLNVLFFTLMIRVFELTKSNTAVSIVVLTTTVPNMILGAIAGVLVDRWDRKIVMFMSHFLRALAVLAFLLSSESIIWLYVLASLISFVSQFFFPAEAAMIGVVVSDKKKLLTATSLFSLTFFSSVILGNILAGPSVLLIGYEWTFVLVAIAFSVAAVFTSRVPGMSVLQFIKEKKYLFSLHRIEKKANSGLSLFHDFLEGLDYIYRNKHIKSAVILMAVAQVIVGTLGAIAPGIATSILHLGASQVSLLVMAPAAVGMVIGAVLLGHFFSKKRKSQLVKVGIFSVSIILMLYSLVGWFADFFNLPIILLSLVILVVLGIFNAFFDIPVNTIIQEGTSEEVRSRVYGVIAMLMGGAGVLPILAVGAVADLFGVKTVVLLLGAVLFGIVLLSDFSKLEKS